MKKLSFLPVVFMFIFSGCGSKEEIVAPSSKQGISASNSRGEGGPCPRADVGFMYLDDELDNYVTCSSFGQCPNQSSIFYNPGTNLYYGLTSDVLTIAQQDQMIADANNLAMFPPPSVVPCGGGPFTWKLDFYKVLYPGTNEGAIRVRITYFCC